MELLHHFARAMLLPWLIGSYAMAEDSSASPNQYAEVVLRVEGMI